MTTVITLSSSLTSLSSSIAGTLSGSFILESTDICINIKYTQTMLAELTHGMKLYSNHINDAIVNPLV